MLFWGKQAVCQFSVIGDQKKSFRVLIQTSYREQIISFFICDQIQNCLVPVIFCCGNNTCRFMEHIILFFSVSNLFSFKTYSLCVLIDFKFRFFHRLPINHNTSAADQFFDFTSGSLPHLGKIFVYAHHAD